MHANGAAQDPSVSSPSRPSEVPSPPPGPATARPQLTLAFLQAATASASSVSFGTRCGRGRRRRRARASSSSSKRPNTIRRGRKEDASRTAMSSSRSRHRAVPDSHPQSFPPLRCSLSFNGHRWKDGCTSYEGEIASPHNLTPQPHGSPSLASRLQVRLARVPRGRATAAPLVPLPLPRRRPG